MIGGKENKMRICLYGAASPTIDKEYIEKVEILGKEMAKRGHSLVFGGGANGLMGAAARGVRSENGYILGVIPEFFCQESVEVVYDNCDKLIRPNTMRERKQIMDDNADAFIIVPGGIGTFEEFFEILTLRQLCRHNKPIAIYNVKNYYDELVKMLEIATEKEFIRGGCMDLFKLCNNIEELFNYIEKPTDKTYTIKQLKNG